MINSDYNLNPQTYKVVEHQASMPPVSAEPPKPVDYDDIIEELKRSWVEKYPKYYPDFISGSMLGKDNTKANITNILLILFNKLDESFITSVDNNREFDINSKKMINTLYTNQKEALKRILSVYGNDKVDVDLKSIIAFLSGYVIELVKLVNSK